MSISIENKRKHNNLRHVKTNVYKIDPYGYAWAYICFKCRASFHVEASETKPNHYLRPNQQLCHINIFLQACFKMRPVVLNGSTSD